MLNASQKLGTALGLAIFSAIATTRTSTLLTAHAPRSAALTAGFHRALLACAIFLLAAAVIALRAANSRAEPVTHPASPMPPATRFPRRNRPADLVQVTEAARRPHAGTGQLTPSPLAQAK